MIQVYHKIIHYDLRRTYYQTSISEKIKVINNKVEQNQAQYNLEDKLLRLQLYHQKMLGDMSF